MDASYPLVSAIVLNYNGAKHLPACLDSLSRQDYPRLEIVVADNGSSDESEAVCTQYPGVIFASLGTNYGFGRGNNCGARHSKGEYLFFVNNDMRFAVDVVSRLMDIAEADGTLFALDVKQLNWDGSRVIHGTLHLKRTLDPRSPFSPFIDYTQVDCDKMMVVPFANGANFFCRRSMFEALGGFDPTFFADHEDQDLGWRAWMRGWKTLYVPEAVCWHKVGASFGSAGPKHTWTSLSKKRFESSMRNRARFIMKTCEWGENVVNFLASHILAATYLLAGRPYQSWVMIWSFWVNVLDLKEVLRQRRDAHLGCVYSSRQLIQKFLASQ